MIVSCLQRVLHSCIDSKLHQTECGSWWLPWKRHPTRRREFVRQKHAVARRIESKIIADIVLHSTISHPDERKPHRNGDSGCDGARVSRLQAVASHEIHVHNCAIPFGSSGGDNDVLCAVSTPSQARSLSSRPQCRCMRPIVFECYGNAIDCSSTVLFYFCSQRHSGAPAIYKLTVNACFHSVASNTFIGYRRVSTFFERFNNILVSRRHEKQFLKKIKLETKKTIRT